MTNAGVSAIRSAEITDLLRAVGVAHVRVFGSTWLNQQIHENKRLRMLVPRVYGLGDLSQILDERAYVQARSILDSMREDLAKVVVTDTYRQSVEAIDRHSFVLLTGEPASGKTTIASLLSLAAIDQWNASVLKLDDPGEVVSRWNPNEPSQFFWLDDAFGVMQYEDSLVRRWNHILPRIEPMLQRGAKIVMTSRDYIYKRARVNLKHTAFPLLEESKVVIDVHELTTQEKEQILYNHIKPGNQPKHFRTEIKPHLEQAARHPRFIPEIARRLGNRFFTKGLHLDQTSINDFIERREQLLQEVIQGLDSDSRAALALIFMRNGRLASPIQLRPLEAAALKRLGSTISGCILALDTLSDSLVRYMAAADEFAWQFSHPTVGDAYAAILAQSPEHIEIFVQGSQPDRLIGQVTCGDVGFENTLVIPKSLFPSIMSKLKTIETTKSYSSSFLARLGVTPDLYGFLTYRCSKEFLSMYLERYPAILNDVSRPGLYLEASPDVRLATRLHEFGLLPDEHRKTFVESICEYALDGEDASALSNQGIRDIFTVKEYNELVKRLRAEILPRLEDIRTDWELNYSSGEPPEAHMGPLLSYFESLLLEFGEEQPAAAEIDFHLSLTKDWIYENQAHVLEEDTWELGNIESTTQPETTRSIFDDIDAEE